MELSTSPARYEKYPLCWQSIEFLLSLLRLTMATLKFLGNKKVFDKWPRGSKYCTFTLFSGTSDYIVCVDEIDVIPEIILVTVGSIVMTLLAALIARY